MSRDPLATLEQYYANLRISTSEGFEQRLFQQLSAEATELDPVAAIKQLSAATKKSAERVKSTLRPVRASRPASNTT